MPPKDTKTSRLESWERNIRKWYVLYFYVGIGINFLLYFTKPWGFDPSGSIFWGSFYGIGIPLTTMFLCVHIHKKIAGV